jgi:TolA-binding protein
MAAVILCMAALACTAAGLAQTGISNVSGMEMRVGFSKTELVVGEPLFLEIKVTNRTCEYGVSNFEARLFFSETADIEVRVQRPGELPERYVGIHQSSITSSERLNLKQGEYTNYERTILYDPKSPTGYLFDRPGEYVIVARLGHTILAEPAKTYTETPATRITVRAPEGKAAEALKIIDSPECAKAIHAQESGDAGVAQKIRKVAEEYPETPYAPMCRLFCGWYEMHRQKPDYAAAVKDYREFLTRYPGHIKAPPAMFQIALCYHNLGRPELVMAWLLHIRQADPGFSLFRSENRLVNFYYFEKLEALSARRWWLYDKPWQVATPPPKVE